MKMTAVLRLISFALFAMILICACSEKEVAGGITDIDHSITISGLVVDANGNAVASARVVAYIDNSIAIEDSVETISDSQGKYDLVFNRSIENDTVMLYAEQGSLCGLSNYGVSQNAELKVSAKKSLEGTINGQNDGYVRIKGTSLKAEIAEDGTFHFNAVPSGENMVLQYVRDSSAVTAYSISVTDSSDTIVLPAIIEIHLPMDGKELVYDNDSTKAENVNYVDGIVGKAIDLEPSQFIELDSIALTDGDFTLSLWTKWNGPNGNHQILVSQRSYWSDSTSKFQWHFENDGGQFSVMKSAPVRPDQISFGDSSIVPVGEWSFLTLVSKNHNFSMYVNGVQVGETSSFIPNQLEVYVPFRIGGNEIKTETWNGLIDEVRIESVARSEEWIKSMWESLGSNTL